MSDSVDRVFSHALNTVNKIRTGSQKPPSATRLRLYGLYKQAMEGDVDGIMERPSGSSEVEQRAREKWDAWKHQNGLSRTEAKRRYITTLIDTMHKYASPSPDSRELVAELEFVWDQVKSNVPSSQSSSPHKEMEVPHLQTSEYGAQLGQSRAAAMDDSGRRRDNYAEDVDHDDENNNNNNNDGDDDRPLRVKSPMSRSEEDLEEEEADIDAGEEFVDAPDSQYNPAQEQQDARGLPPYSLPPQHSQQQPLQQISRRNPQPVTPTPQSKSRMRTIIPQPIPMPNFGGTPSNNNNNNNNKDDDKDKTRAEKLEKQDLKWKTRIEASLMRMTAEVAALREQLEARRLFSHSPHYRFFRGIWRWATAGLKHLTFDLGVLGLVLIWLRWKGDPRLEAAIRGFVGQIIERVGRRVGVRRGMGVPFISGAKKKEL